MPSAVADAMRMRELLWAVKAEEEGEQVKQDEEGGGKHRKRKRG